MNTVILIGRLVKDPQLATTQNGKEYCQFTLAVNRQFKDKSGERQADFIQCVVWGQTAKNLCQYQSKGNLINILGSLQTNKYTDKSGVERYITQVLVEQIEFLEKKKEAAAPAYNPDAYDPQNYKSSPQPQSSVKPEDFVKPEKPSEQYMNDNFSDDLPF